MGAIEELQQRLGVMPKAEFEKIHAEASNARKAIGLEKWIPNVGPQTDAFHSQADVLGFGGIPGGGKTELGLGTAFSHHKRTLMLRRQYTDLSGLIDAAIRINGSREGFNGSPPPRLTMAQDQFIDFAGCARLGDERHWLGRAHDLIVPDETTEFLELQIRFFIGFFSH